MRQRANEHSYFEWLCAIVERHQISTPSLTHWNLFRQMHNTEFVWVVMMDENRVEDGRELRRTFARTIGDKSHNWLNEMSVIEPSVLEVLVAFALRIPDMVGYYATPREWFWHMLQNLGLDVFDDAHYDQDLVDAILTRFIWRGYGYSGEGGGLFPLESPSEDQRLTELWYQLAHYVYERGDHL